MYWFATSWPRRLVVEYPPARRVSSTPASADPATECARREVVGWVMNRRWQRTTRAHDGFPTRVSIRTCALSGPFTSALCVTYGLGWGHRYRRSVAAAAESGEDVGVRA